MSFDNLKRRVKVLVASADLALGSSAASAILFDFESETAGNKGATLVLSSGGLTLTITRIGVPISESWLALAAFLPPGATTPSARSSTRPAASSC
jgi:hypothetical protein